MGRYVTFYHPIILVTSLQHPYNVTTFTTFTTFTTGVSEMGLSPGPRGERGVFNKQNVVKML